MMAELATLVGLLLQHKPHGWSKTSDMLLAGPGEETQPPRLATKPGAFTMHFMLPKMNKDERALAKGPICRAAQPEQRKEKEMPQDVTPAVPHHFSPTRKIKWRKYKCPPLRGSSSSTHPVSLPWENPRGQHQPVGSFPVDA